MTAVLLLIALPVGHPATETAHAEATAIAVRPDDPYAAHIAEAAQRFSILESWIRAVMHAESAGIAHAVSAKGAMGLMQITPDTWEELRAGHGLGSDPFDPRDNILAGAAYIRELLDGYGSPGFLAAYNAGPARYEEYLATGRSLPFETQVYLANLVPLVGALPFDGTIGVAGVAGVAAHCDRTAVREPRMAHVERQSGRNVRATRTPPWDRSGGRFPCHPPAFRRPLRPFR